MKKPTKSLAKKRAYKAFQLYLRKAWTISGFVECYTCNRVLTYKQVQVGHWLPGHSNSTYINELYVRPQDYYCNIQLGGNQGEFRDRIRKELGDKVVDRLIQEAKQTINISTDRYLEIEAYYKKRLQDLTK